MKNQVAIHENAISEKVVKFIDLANFTNEFVKMYDNNNINGCYYLNGEIVAEDVWQNVHSKIVKVN